MTTSADKRPARLTVGVLCVLLTGAAAMAGGAGWLYRGRSGRLCSLKVSASPPGCGVSLDGSYLGVAPTTVAAVSPGEHFVGATRDGYRAKTVRVRVDSSSEPGEVRVELQPLETCRIEVRSDPPGATVTVNGENRGNTPMVITGVPPGEHRVVLRRARYEPWCRTLRLAAGKSQRVEARLEDSFLKFLNGAVAADPKNMFHRAERFHYMMTRENWPGAADSLFDAMVLTARDGVADPGKGGLWYWFTRDAGVLARDRKGTFGKRLGQRLNSFAEDNPQAAAKLVNILGARSKMRSRWMRNPAMLRKLCFDAVVGAAGNRVVAETGLSLAAELRSGGEVKRIMTAAAAAKPGDSKHIGMLAIKVVNLVKGGGIGGSFRGEALQVVVSSTEKCLTAEKDKMLRGRLHRLLAKAQVLQDKLQDALSDQEKAIAELRSVPKADAALLALWRLEKALLLVELKRAEEAVKLLKELSTKATAEQVRTRAAEALTKLKTATK